MFGIIVAFLVGGFVGAFIMALVAGATSKDNYDDTDHLKYV